MKEPVDNCVELSRNLSTLKAITFRLDPCMGWKKEGKGRRQRINRSERAEHEALFKVMGERHGEEGGGGRGKKRERHARGGIMWDHRHGPNSTSDSY